MEEAMNGRRIPAFGSWNQCEMLPAGHYSGPASQGGVIPLRSGYGGGGGHLYPPHLPYSYYYYGQASGEDLFQVPGPPPMVVAAYPRKVRKEAPSEKQLKRRQQRQKGEEEAPQQQKKQGKVSNCKAAAQQPFRRPRAGMAVDEDLYKVPPKLLYAKPRRKKTVMSDFWSSCLGLNCIP